uniref:Uncharacterized protein n=1 Tax=Bubo bubo TaxID=30461 RepID=A0A8C0IEI9_BUBBB
VGAWTPSTAHPEVLGVHVQLVTVEFAQLSKTFLDVVQVLDSFPEGGEHFLAMGTDHGVASDGGGAGEVPKGSEEPLGPGVDDQQPGERWRDTSPFPPPSLSGQASSHTHALVPAAPRAGGAACTAVGSQRRRGSRRLGAEHAGQTQEDRQRRLKSLQSLP